MARIYRRDSKGRFASGGGGGSFSSLFNNLSGLKQKTGASSVVGDGRGGLEFRFNGISSRGASSTAAKNAVLSALKKQKVKTRKNDYFELGRNPKYIVRVTAS